MNFSNEICPLCQSKLHVTGSTRRVYYCKRSKMFIKKYNYTTQSWMFDIENVEVYHYNYQVWKEGAMVECIFEPYLVRYCLPIGKTRIFYLPETNDQPKFIAEVPSLELNLSRPKAEIVDRIRKLVMFS